MIKTFYKIQLFRVALLQPKLKL